MPFLSGKRAIISEVTSTVPYPMSKAFISTLGEGKIQGKYKPQAWQRCQNPELMCAHTTESLWSDVDQSIFLGARGNGR